MAKFTLSNFRLIGNKLKEGDKAPDFELVDINGEIKTLKDYPNKIKVISCFPSIDTGVCDMQTRTFAKDYEEDDNVIVLNVSVDLPFAFSRWNKENNLNVVALSDYRTREFGKNYGILMDPYMTLYRSVFVLDKNNKIALASYNKEIKEPVNFELVKDVILKLENKNSN